MNIYYHGGSCCGISHIVGFGLPPGSTLAEVPQTTGSAAHSYGSTPILYKNLPQETALERLDRLIKIGIQDRRSGIIEAVLADYCGVEHQSVVWGPILLERGFVEVNSAFNSNTDNRCRVYHLNYGQDLYADAPDKCEEFAIDDDDDDDYCGNPDCDYCN